jgi:hypothetical protein
MAFGGAVARAPGALAVREREDVLVSWHQKLFTIMVWPAGGDRAWGGGDGRAEGRRRHQLD